MATDSQETTADEHQGLQGVAEKPSALSITEDYSDDDSQGAGTLQLFPCCRKHDLTMDIPPGGGEIALQVVESKESKAKPDLGWYQAGAEGVCLSSADSFQPGGMNRRACVKTCASARVSVTEEPGAGKPHAGICAGGAG